MVLMMKSVCLASDQIYLSDLHHARTLVRDADIAQFKTNEQNKKHTHDVLLNLKCLILPGHLGFFVRFFFCICAFCFLPLKHCAAHPPTHYE